MSQSIPEGDRESRSLWHFVTRRSLPLEREHSVYILVSALDVFMTYILLRYGGFVESNPVAHYFYADWDIAGMAIYKFGAVAVVSIFAQIIAHHKLRTARALLNFASLITACVVIYSFSLLLSNPPQF